MQCFGCAFADGEGLHVDRGEGARAVVRIARRLLHDLEARLRKLTHNEDEQGLFIASAPDRVDSWALPMDGGIERHALERIIQEMVKRDRLQRPIAVGDVFKDDAVRDAYRNVSTRGELKPAFDKAMAAVEKYGF